MPKNKRPIESTRTSSRRQASKEALKQMQLLLDDEDDDAFVLPDDEEDKKEIRLEPPPPPPPKKRALSPMMESPPPKKKYKLSHRKSSDGNDRDVIVLKSISNSNYVPKENTLELECFVEELSDVQKERQKKLQSEEKELQAKLEELLKSKKAEVVYTGEISSAVEVNELVTNCGKKSIFKPSDLPQLDEKDEQSAPAFHFVVDPRFGIIVGTVPKPAPQVQTQPPPLVKSKIQLSAAVKAVATIPQNSTPVRNMRTRKSVIPTPSPTIQTRGNNAIPTRASTQGVITRGNANTPRANNSSPRTNNSTPRTNNPTPVRAVTQAPNPVPSPSIQTRAMKTTPTIQTRNNKATPPTAAKRPVVNVPVEKPTKQVVDLTSDDNRNQADNREISFNKLQGKTYPSLVVVARPHLRVTDLGVDRSKLDSKVKSVLMHPPTKFTEWLIQQGLIRVEQKCPVHSTTQLKLGMYSDVSKFPFSGGYVWISECCPQRFISVFNGSFFEGSPHPPMVILKLIYHWSCQTNIQNVTQWVKVDNLYVKGVYTWLRGVCTLAVQSRLRQLGGPGVRIEVGVISLGTTSHDGNQRQVKVEVLGVLETNTKYVRLRAVEPMPDGDKNFRKKFSKILEPILHWVHPASTILTDLTVDKATLHHMGFTNVIQTTSNDYNQSNRTIMEYLRRIVPRMFQNTLSLLSRQIIQQFLDELVWREWFGITSQMAFDNIITHIAEQTRLNPHTPLVLKLNKVAANPFRSWSNGTQNQAASNSATIPPAPLSPEPVNTTPVLTKTPTPVLTKVPTPVLTKTSTPVPTKTPVAEVKKYGRGKKSNSPQVQAVQERPTKPVSPDVPEQMVPLENYYYGTINPINTSPAKITLNMKCPFCKSTFDNNILLQNHLFKHAHNVSNDAYLCRYCLTSVSTANELIHHVNKCHPGDTKFDYGFVCLICEIHYMNPFVLGKHMSKEHIPHELPYQCGSCSFRCSNHKQVIDHFYMKHDGGSAIQCPFCLKSTTVWSGGRNVAQNIHYFIQHLQKHQKKQFAKRCGKCNLWFVQKEVLKEHQQKMHISLRGKMGLVPYPSPRNGVMVPKSKTDKDPCDAEVINFSSLYYNLSNKSVCKECNQTISSSKHFPSFDNCQNPNCQYSTCCAIAMMTHNAKCKGLNSVIPPETLPFEMFCVCGFKDVDGNSMAKHLAICEKKSAYPSEAEAKSATVMHSMLDILGLVRKPEESKNEKSTDNSNVAETNESIEESSKVSNKEIESNEISILSDEEMETELTNRDKASDVSVEINSEKDTISKYKEDEESKSETNKKSADIPDQNDEISNDKKEIEIVQNKISDIIDLDEEDVIMSEVLNKSPQSELNEDKEEINTEVSNHICDKTDKSVTCTEQNEQEIRDPMSEIGITDINSITDNEEQQISTIEKEDPSKGETRKDHLIMEVEGDQTEIKEQTIKVETVEDHTDENIGSHHSNREINTEYLTEKEIVQDHTKETMEADQTEEEIETNHTKKAMDTKGEIIPDNTEAEIEADYTKAMEAGHTEEEIVDPTEKENKLDHDIQEIVEDNSKKEVVTDYIEQEILPNNFEMTEPREKETKVNHAEKEMEVDHAEKEMEVDHAETQMELDHAEEEIVADHTEKELIADKSKKETIDHSEQEIIAEHSEKQNLSDHTESHLEEGIDIELAERENEESHMLNEERHILEGIEKNIINDEEKDNNEEEIDNYLSADINEKGNSEEISENLLDSDITKYNEYSYNEESIMKLRNESSHLNDKIEESYESMEQSVSEEKIDVIKDFIIEEQKESLTSEINSSKACENNLCVSDIDFEKVSTITENKDSSEIVDNEKLLDSEPSIQSENENMHEDIVMKDSLPTGDVMPVTLNSTQGSTSMDVD